MARDAGVRNQLLGVAVILLFGAVLVGTTLLLFLWFTNGL